MNPKTVSTERRIEQYQGIIALLQTWEEQSAEVQLQEHNYILQLRQRARQIRNYITHRADAAADIL